MAKPVFALPLSSVQWYYKQHDDSDPHWHAAASFPSEIHIELLKAGEIPDPLYRFNEQQIQWIGDVEWLYKCAFRAPAESSQGLLQFDGLDTVCDVFLNGKAILHTENMFQSHSVYVDVKADEGENELLLHFKSAGKLGQELEAIHGRVRAGSTNLGDPGRVYVRKAQYSWRWDWGPEVMSVGPYLPITFKAFTSRIADVATYAIVSYPSLDTAKLRVDLELEGALPPSASWVVVLSDRQGKAVKSAHLPLENLKSKLEWEFVVGKDVDLWYPVGYGEAKLYSVTVELQSDGQTIDTYNKSSVGFRTVRLIQEPLEVADEYGKGRSFVFEINGIRIFAGGSNMIPLSNFLTTFAKLSPAPKAPGAQPKAQESSPSRYKALLELARDGNQNMIRVWGGGVFAAEGEGFWETCDELGLLVWHDFLFACGVYPGQLPDFVASVDKEARDIVKRVRHHPSLALLCGNNEDYQMVLQWGDVPSLPARQIYEEVLPKVVRELTQPPLENSSSFEFPELSKLGTLPPTQLFGELVPYPCVPYHPGSPYTGVISRKDRSSPDAPRDKWSETGWDTADPTVGDVHQWHVWGGKERPWQEYDILGGRFISEFGLPSHPALETIQSFAGADMKGLHAQSPIIAEHTRAGLYERRLAIVMNDTFRVSEDLETYVFLTQLMQSEGIGYAYSVWKRKWKGNGREETSGVLVWQLNDSWPGTSWAISDYFLRPKPVYYNIKRQLSSFAVGIYRTVEKSRMNDRPKQFYEFGSYLSKRATLAVWAVNASLKDRQVTVELECVDLNPNASSWRSSTILAQNITLPENRATEISDLESPSNPTAQDVTVGGFYPATVGDNTTTYTVVACVRLLDANTGEILGRSVDWPQPYRYLTWYLDQVDPRIVVSGKKVQEGKVVLDVTAERPVKCLFLTLDLVRPVEGGALDYDYDKVRWSDNALDLMPAETISLVVEGPGVNKGSMTDLKAAWLGREKKASIPVQWR